MKKSNKPVRKVRTPELPPKLTQVNNLMNASEKSQNVAVPANAELKTGRPHRSKPKSSTPLPRKLNKTSGAIITKDANDATNQVVPLRKVSSKHKK